MGSLIDFFLNEAYTEDDLNGLINNKAEESLYLEFKSSGSLQTSDNKKNEIAKDISAFANADGGVLIYGIQEVNHIADSFSFVDGNQFTKEWLENVIQSRISRHLPDLAIYPVRFSNDFTKTVYVVKIGRSYQAPHMTSEKKYFRRVNFQVLQMEEYEVRDAYNRINKSVLTFDELLITSNGHYMQAGTLGEANYLIGFQIKNIGSTIENQYKLEVAIPTVLTRNPNPMAMHKVRKEAEMDVYSIPNSSPLFQNELTTLATFSLVFNAQTKEHLARPIHARLYFSGGMLDHAFELNDKLRYGVNTIYSIW